MFKDFFGNILEIGDKVAYLNHSKTSSCLKNSEVVDFTKTMVRLKGINWNGEDGLKSADKIIKRIE